MTKVPVSWRKSSFSAQDTDCVEVAGTLTAVRDTKNPDVTLEVTPAVLASFVRALAR